MQSQNIVFTGKNQVEVRAGAIPAFKTGLNQVEVSALDAPTLQSGQILVETRRSLISTGTDPFALKQSDRSCW